jgi:hypothetical protein
MFRFDLIDDSSIRMFQRQCVNVVNPRFSICKLSRSFRIFANFTLFLNDVSLSPLASLALGYRLQSQ